MKNKKILFIGPVPPPFGGISIHIKRLSTLLENDFEIDFIDEANPAKPGYFNIRSKNPFGYIKKIAASNLIYIHSGNHILRMFHILLSKLFFKKIILTLHAYPFDKKLLMKKTEEFIYKQADKIILVNENLFSKIKLPEKKCVVQNAFLPPVMETEVDLPDKIITEITKMKDDGKTILVANAWQLEIFKGEDLYGLDMCIEAISNLKRMNVKAGFIFNVSSTDKLKDVYLNYQAKIIELGLKDDFILINEKLSFVKLIEKTDIVLRPTNTDGDALTVREAIYLGKPVVASDVIDRPAGTILFKNRDVADLTDKLSDVINKNLYKGNKNTNESANTYYEIYKNLINSVIIKN